MARTVVATTTFVATGEDGQTVIVHAGQRFDATHPVARAHAASFEDEATHGVHQAPKRRARKA